MTHAESQDLLLDLAYGELAPPRAVELELHLAGCAECQKEKAAIDEARRLAAPLRAREEPPPGFDAPILAAARAQAQLEHEGNIGEVIEVQGSVRPLGLEPGQVDAHAAVARREAQRRPRWMVRVALGGSVAAAAALALVMSTSLQQKHEDDRAARLATDKAFEIRVQPAPLPQAAGEAVREAKKEEPARALVLAGKLQEDESKSRRKSGDARRADRAAEPQELDAPGALAGVRGGSGGDALDLSTAPEPVAPPSRAVAPPPPDDSAPRPAPAVAAKASPTGPSQPAPRAAAEPPPPPPPPPPAAAPAAGPPAVEKLAARAEAPPATAGAGAQGAGALAQNRAQTAATAAASSATSSATAGARAQAPGAADLERQAQEARHGGSYPLAALLYRRAAGLRHDEAPLGNEGAWDLAHAVECLAAAGSFDEARVVRDELARLYPAEPGAFAAAGRALREVDSPAQRNSKPAAKAKSDNSSAVPADF